MSSKINIEQLEEYLKQAGLENGKLEEVLSPIKELNNQRRYGLVWEYPDNNTYGSDSAEQELLRNFPFLKEVNEHRIFNGEQHPDHLLIEGDNLHALKTMQYTHKNKIDVIYIDPPYNTGNTDFVYNDKYVDNEDSWRHSKWLSFMNKRLRLARELMTDEGVIFISIDDNELYQLKLLCDQIFGEDNFVGNIIWNKRVPKNNSIGLGNIHEYVLVYRRSSNNKKTMYVRKEGVKEIEELISEGREEGKTVKDLENELKKLYKDKKYPRAITLYNNIDGNYKVYGKINLGSPNNKSKTNRFDIEHPITGEPVKIPTNGWRWTKETFEDNMKGDAQEFEDGSAIRGKVWFSGDSGVQPSSILYLKEQDKNLLSTIISLKSDGGITLNGVLGDEMFSYPKPVNLIKLLIESTTYDNPNATVLDFFAGSGTTSHAVMELNKEDGGNRKSILVTNNEINSSEEEDFLVEKGYVEPFTGSRRGTKKHAKWLESINEFKETPDYKELIETDEYKDLGIARAVTEQRINKVINGYTTPKGKEVEGLDNNNFYHFEIVLEPDLLDGDLNTYMLINKTKDIIKVKEDVYANEVDISTDNTPAIKLVNDEKEVIVVQSVRVFEEDIHELVQNFNDVGKEHIIYTSYTGFEYGTNNIRFEELPKELLQAIKHDENN